MAGADPHQTPITRERHRVVYEHFQRLFDNDLDKSCGTPGQLYYTPTCPFDAAADYVCFHEVGELFDPMQLPEPPAEVQSVPVQSAQPPEANASPREADRLRDALAHLDPDPREEWIKVGLAIKHDLGEEGMAAWLGEVLRSQTNRRGRYHTHAGRFGRGLCARRTRQAQQRCGAERRCVS
jgi:hypothetical protein